MHRNFLCNHLNHKTGIVGQPTLISPLFCQRFRPGMEVVFVNFGLGMWEGRVRRILVDFYDYEQTASSGMEDLCVGSNGQNR